MFHSDSRRPKKAETSSQRADEPPISKGLGCLGLENVIAGTEKTHDLQRSPKRPRQKRPQESSPCCDVERGDFWRRSSHGSFVSDRWLILVYPLVNKHRP